jgi:hypothetical protein
MKPILILWLLLNVATCPLVAAEPLLERTEVFPPGLNAIARNRIPGVVVTPRGTVLCLYERADSIDCASFNLEWITAP